MFEGVRSPACALIATEPLLHSGLSCAACERPQPPATGSVAGLADASNSSVAATGPAWETLVVIGCGDFLGNIVRGVTGALLPSDFTRGQAPHLDYFLWYTVTPSCMLLE